MSSQHSDRSEGQSGSHRACRKRGAESKAAILAAAERIFAREGFNGASTRDIAAQAGVTLNLIAHHFGTKENLFIAAVEHRYDEWHARVSASLDAATACADVGPRTLIRAFIAPFVACLASGDEGWIDYLRLLGRGMNVYSVESIHPALHRLSDIPNAFRAALRQHGAVHDDVALGMASYLLEVALTYIVQDKGLLRARTGGQVAVEELDRWIEFLTDYFHGAFTLSGAIAPLRPGPP